MSGGAAAAPLVGWLGQAGASSSPGAPQGRQEEPWGHPCPGAGRRVVCVLTPLVTYLVQVSLIRRGRLAFEPTSPWGFLAPATIRAEAAQAGSPFARLCSPGAPTARAPNVPAERRDAPGRRPGACGWGPPARGLAGDASHASFSGSPADLVSPPHGSLPATLTPRSPASPSQRHSIVPDLSRPAAALAGTRASGAHLGPSVSFTALSRSGSPCHRRPLARLPTCSLVGLWVPSSVTAVHPPAPTLMGPRAL